MSVGRLLTILSAIAVVLFGGCGGHDSLSEVAAAYRSDLASHQEVGTIRFGSRPTVVSVRVGIDQQDLDNGVAGWYPHSNLPGMGGVVYLAGHRTTHGGPFRPVASMSAGSRVVFRLPYAVATYTVTGRRLVEETDVGILNGRPQREQLRLQTSTFPGSSIRVIVFASLSEIERR